MTREPTSSYDAASVAEHLEHLAETLAAARFATPALGAADAEAERAALLRLVEAYARPRLNRPVVPLTAVVFGASGVGKSAIVNGLAARQVGTPGPIRPGTERAAAWVHDDDPALSLAPDLDIVRSADRLVAGVTVIDAPPPQLVTEHGPTAEELLDVADLGIHVASAGRYADAAAWSQIEAAAARGLPLLHVLNRLPGDSDERRAVAADYAARLHAAGLLDPEGTVLEIGTTIPVAGHGGLPEEAVAELAAALAELAQPAAAAALVQRTHAGTLRALADRAERLAAVLEAQAAMARELGALATAASEDHGRRVAGLAAVGALPIRPGGRWEDEREDLTWAATRAAGAAAQDAAAAWSEHPAGRPVVVEHKSLWRHGAGTEEAALDHFEGWFELVAAAARLRHPRWWSVRKRRALAAALRIAALRPDADAGLGEVLGERADAVVAGMRSELGAALRRTLLEDLRRFFAALPDPEAGGRKAAALARVAASLRGVVGP